MEPSWFWCVGHGHDPDRRLWACGCQARPMGFEPTGAQRPAGGPVRVSVRVLVSADVGAARRRDYANAETTRGLPIAIAAAGDYPSPWLENPTDYGVGRSPLFSMAAGVGFEPTTF